VAGRIPDSTIEEIRLRTDIVDLISSYGIQIKRAGSSYKACCPFHHEKTPSFHINREKGLYHCFGCGESGSVFTFVQKQEGMEFDCFNGLPPTRANLYKAYEFSAVWVWTSIIHLIKAADGDFSETWYKKYRGVLASVMKKYPKITGVLISIADLHVPGNKLLDNSKMENADFDNDHTDEVLADDKAEEFKTWILKWCDKATEKDKMRVRRWFETKKSHKQIFAEINKVVGNPAKFNARLALFVERLFNQEGLEYFFEKTGFATKEDMFLAYFDKLTDFDEGTKKSFIKKYLLGK
jgi:hypothetical protein